jgi:hypothetical protein
MGLPSSVHVPRVSLLLLRAPLRVRIAHLVTIRFLRTQQSAYKCKGVKGQWMAPTLTPIAGQLRKKSVRSLTTPSLVRRHVLLAILTKTRSLAQLFVTRLPRRPLVSPLVCRLPNPACSHRAFLPVSPLVCRLPNPVCSQRAFLPVSPVCSQRAFLPVSPLVCRLPNPVCSQRAILPVSPRRGQVGSLVANPPVCPRDNQLVPPHLRPRLSRTRTTRWFGTRRE